MGHRQLTAFLIVISAVCHKFSDAAYKEHFVNSERICPNPLHLNTEEFPKHTLLVNLPQTISFFAPVDFPCNFASDPSEEIPRKVIVRAIHPSKKPWDFGTSAPCDNFIKFKRSEWPEAHHDADSPRKDEVICRVWKRQPENALHTGPFFHPMIWNSPNKMMTLSFSTTDWDTTFDNKLSSRKKSAYLQMVFLVYGNYGKSCSLRLQQYLLDPLNTPVANNCSVPSLRTCGQYDCSQVKSLLDKLGFLTFENDEINKDKKETAKITPMTTTATSSRVRTSAPTWALLTTLPTRQAQQTFTSPSTILFDNNPKITDKTSPATDPPEVETGPANATVQVTTSSSVFVHNFTTQKTTRYYTGHNPVGDDYHSWTIAAVVIAPVAVIVLAIWAIRCYVHRCAGGLEPGYGSTEDLLHAMAATASPRLRRAPHRVVMHTTVMEDGRVELAHQLPHQQQHLRMSPYRRPVLTRNNSMDYIQPIRNSHYSLIKTNAFMTTHPPSYEALGGPPRYYDAIVI